MVQGEIILLTGGVRSGKSAYALSLCDDLAIVQMDKLAKKEGEKEGDIEEKEKEQKGAMRQKFFLATAEPVDSEMVERIKNHQQERIGWQTIEESIEIHRAIDNCPGQILIVDCLTVWLGNLFHHFGLQPNDGEHESQNRIKKRQELCDLACAAITRRRQLGKHTVIITNEVGYGLVPPDPISRAYRDDLGKLNSRMATAASQVYLMVCGLPSQIK